MWNVLFIICFIMFPTFPVMCNRTMAPSGSTMPQPSPSLEQEFVTGNEEENIHGRLYTDLLEKYGEHGPYMRPVLNPKTKTTVIYRLLVNELINLDVRNQIIEFSALMKMVWTDEILRWNKTDYGGIELIHLPSDVIWSPDITLHRNIDDEFEHIKNTPVNLYHDGKIEWYAPSIFVSSCRIQVRYFPFDTQACELRFGSWVHTGSEIDLYPGNGTDTIQDYFRPNGVWDLIDVMVEREAPLWSCCPDPWPELIYTIIFRRRPGFYVFYLVVPCVFISVLSLLVFYLPTECGEKLTLSITNLLALVVFQQLIAESMPEGGEDPPVLGDYFLAMISLVCASVITTVLVIHISAKKEPVPHWVQQIFLRYIARLTYMYEKEYDRSAPGEKVQVVKVKFNPKSIDDVVINQKYDGSFSRCDPVIEDVHFIRRDIEDKNAELLAFEQWRHVGKVLDRCFLIVFSIILLITSAILLSTATNIGSDEDYIIY